MKHGVKRLFALFLAAVTVCVMFVVPVLAAPSYKDTLKDGHKYTIYTAVDKRMALQATSNNISIYPSNWGNSQTFTISKVSGEWYKIVSFSGKALDVYGINKKPGTNVFPCAYNGGDNQLWKFVKDGDGYRIQSKLGTFLDVAGSGTANGTNVQSNSETKKNAQLWYLEDLELNNGFPDARFLDTDSKAIMPLELPYATTPHSNAFLPLMYIRAGETVTRTIQSRGPNVRNIAIAMWNKEVSEGNKDTSAEKKGISIKLAEDGKYTPFGGVNNVGVAKFTISADANASGFYTACFVFSGEEGGTNGVCSGYFHIYVDKAPAK